MTAEQLDTELEKGYAQMKTRANHSGKAGV